LEDLVSDTLVTVSNLRTSFRTKLGDIDAVDGISYSIKKGKTLGVVGESGCGKSVTSLSIMGLIEPQAKSRRVLRFLMGSTYSNFLRLNSKTFAAKTWP